MFVVRASRLLFQEFCDKAPIRNRQATPRPTYRRSRGCRWKDLTMDFLARIRIAFCTPGDCVSKAVIERLHIKHALTFDRHFSEFGNVQVLP